MRISDWSSDVCSSDLASSPAIVITDFGSAWIPCGTEWYWRSIGSPIHPGRFGTEPMIIVDKALARLEAEGRPIRVAVIGAGFQGAAVVRQIVKSTPGMRVVGVANRRGEAAVRAYADVGVEASREIGRASCRERVCPYV